MMQNNDKTQSESVLYTVQLSDLMPQFNGCLKRFILATRAHLCNKTETVKKAAVT